MIATVPPISEETQNSEASCLNWAKRGRESTSTLATIWRVVVSMKCAMLVVSEVLIRILPSGLIVHAFRARRRPGRRRCAPASSRSMIGDRVVVLVGDIEHSCRRHPAVNNSGSGPEGRRVNDLPGRGVDHLDGVVVADRDHHEFAVAR